MTAVKVREERVNKKGSTYFLFMKSRRISFLMEKSNPASRGTGISIKFLWLTQKIPSNQHHFIYSQGTGLLQDLCLDAGFGIVNSHCFQMGPKVLTVKET